MSPLNPKEPIMKILKKVVILFLIGILISPLLFSQKTQPSKDKNKPSKSAEKDKKMNKVDAHKINLAFLSNSTKYDTIPFKNREELFDLIASLRSMSGAIFFTGAGFPNLVSVTFVSKKKIPDHVIDRCVPGTKMMFQKFMVKNDDGTQQMLSKSIYLK